MRAWKVSVDGWLGQWCVCVCVSAYWNVYSLYVHVPCVCDWQSSLYFADVYSYREATWHIVNYTCNLSRFFLCRPARFFMWPWLVILSREPRVRTCVCLCIRLFVFECDCGGTSWSMLLSVPPIVFLQEQVWLTDWATQTRKKRTRRSHCGSTERGLFIHLFIFNNICLIFRSCEVLTHSSECQELMYEDYYESTYKQTAFTTLL